jgi:hypothetical protein
MKIKNEYVFSLEKTQFLFERKNIINSCISFECKVESCGTVPNPEKSHLSRPVGQSGRDKRDRDNIEKNRSPEFFFG